jgi:uncharacterized protein (TIGR03032 family)
MLPTPAKADPSDSPKEESPFRCVHSVGFPHLLQQLGVTVLVTSYQAGKLMAVRNLEGRINTLLRSFPGPMGLAIDGQRRLALGTRTQLWFLQNAPDIAPRLEPPGRHDACYLPRQSHVTGNIRGHDIGWAGSELWLVNTLFSCLCTLDANYSFVPRWRPPFVTALAADDRCHLNGLAIADGRPRYVTALGEGDTRESWRANKAAGGCLIDVANNAVIARGLSMPHSPRLSAGRLWLLDSGTGQLQIVDVSNGQRQPVAAVPGFTRGLDFFGPYAFVGLSRIRETSTFGGLPIAERIQELRCGVWVIDIRTGQTVEFLQFEAGIEEIFAVQVLPGIRYPEIVGFQEETIQGVFIVPPDNGMSNSSLGKN